MRVLITSLSKKISLVKAVRLACEKLKKQVVVFGLDADPGCIGSHFVDQFLCHQGLDLEHFISLCQLHEISHIIPSRDGELAFFAKHKKALLQQGIHVMVSGSAAIENTLDKWLFFDTLVKHGFPVIATSENISDLNGERFVVKERFGAGSKDVAIDLSRQEAEKKVKCFAQPLFQPYIVGKEISVDLFLTKKSKTHGIVLRSRDRVVAGESHISTTFQNQPLADSCKEIAETLSLQGHVMLQWIEDLQGNYHLLECNPRFGGASFLSIVAGLDSFFWFFHESLGSDLNKYSFCRSEEEKQLIRYPEDLILSCPMLS